MAPTRSLRCSHSTSNGPPCINTTTRVALVCLAAACGARGWGWGGGGEVTWLWATARAHTPILHAPTQHLDRVDLVARQLQGQAVKALALHDRRQQHVLARARVGGADVCVHEHTWGGLTCAFCRSPREVHAACMHACTHQTPPSSCPAQRRRHLKRGSPRSHRPRRRLAQRRSRARRAHSPPAAIAPHPSHPRLQAYPCPPPPQQYAAAPPPASPPAPGYGC